MCLTDDRTGTFYQFYWSVVCRPLWTVNAGLLFGLEMKPLVPVLAQTAGQNHPQPEQSHEYHYAENRFYTHLLMLLI